MRKLAITPVRLRALVDLQRVADANSRAMLDEASDARLLAAAGRDDLAAPIITSAGRRLRRVLVAAGAAAVLACTLAPISPPTAQAVVLQPAPVRVVLSGATLNVPLVLVSDHPTTAHGGHGVLVSLPTVGGGVLDGEAWSDDAAIYARVTVPARALLLGQQRWEVEDFGDARVTGLQVTVLRASKVTARWLQPVGAGQAVGMVRVTHYDPRIGGYAPSQASPVQVQRRAGGRWTTVTTWTTDPTGTAAGVVSLPNGRQLLRFVRPDGATVATATSPTLQVEVI